MALRYLLDTNICIYIRRSRPAAALARFRGLSAGDAGMSVVTYGELRTGVEKSSDSAKASEVLARLATLLPVAPLPAEAGDIYGEIRGALEQRGDLIGPNDLWIAAHALALNVVLVTNNEKEFRKVKALRIENWTQ